MLYSVQVCVMEIPNNLSLLVYNLGLVIWVKRAYCLPLDPTEVFVLANGIDAVVNRKG